MFFGSVGDLFLPIPLYLIVLLSILCVRAFRQRSTRLGRRRYWLLALVVWSFVFSTPGVANALIGYLEGRYPAVAEPTKVGQEEPLIVVLSTGSMVRRGNLNEVRLDTAGWERTYAGIRLWKRIGGQLLFVGAPSDDGETSIAEFMVDVALASAVPASAVQMETKSRNTHENLLFNREVVAAHGDNVWLVTSAIHMRRAMAVAHALGLQPRAFPCDFRAVTLRHWYAWLPNSGGPPMFSDALHELLGLAYYRLRGRSS